MSLIPDAPIHETSYFWSCLTLQDDCPFFSSADPNLYYFAITLVCLYIGFVLMILADLKFYWSVDHFQRQIDYYVNLVRKKVRHVQLDQRRLMSTQERTEKQLKRSEECRHMVTGIRGALATDDPQQLNALTTYFVDTRPPSRSTWNATRRCPQTDSTDWFS
ncbi:uncharacterized protein LOC111355774 [Spodoptera litura]|uniref:Uncharacterized protein LOC111355774 n=1 Tax=Spodoptera litura TaxID=69820 RepID=A0A9J7IUL1_SPOLT|nr:uncharacterized protein LOC111355774 [Spodoptera litura]